MELVHTFGQIVLALHLKSFFSNEYVVLGETQVKWLESINIFI